MSTPDRKAAITQKEIGRALKAARDVGLPVARFEVDRNGKVIVYTTEAASEAAANDWDRP